jgi:hypothetical protein
MNKKRGVRMLGSIELRKIPDEVMEAAAPALLGNRRRKRFLRTPEADADRLFLFEALLDLRPYVERLQDLHLADLLDMPGPSPAHDARRICAALGARAPSIETFGSSVPSEWKGFGSAEAEAWFLVNFVRYYRHSHDAASPIRARAYANALGRLIEWWRWRREGHDRRAAGKRRSEAAQPKAVAARRAKRAADPPDWWDDARQRASALRRRNPKRTAWDVAKELAPEFERSPRQVYGIIKGLWRR